MPNPLVYNEQPRPRVLLHSVADMSVVTGLIPTTRTTTDGLNSVRSEDWDAIIAIVDFSETIEWASHQCILQIGGQPAWYLTNHLYNPKLTRTLGEGVVLTGEGPPEFRAELKQVAKYISALPLPRTAMKRALNEKVEHFTPLITDRDGNVYAAIYSQTDGPREVIYLPEGLELSRAWVTLALERWSALDPEAFPAGPEWSHRDEWMTAIERQTHDEVVRLERELDDKITELEAQVEDARKRLDEQRLHADGNERLLLTATDDELVQAIAKALRQFGFIVEDRDALGARQKMEDLRVTDGDWTAVGEVKGYTGGGSTTDLLKFSRFTRAFQQETGRFPDGQWYIVNQYRERDPSSRRDLLWGQDADVEAFAESDGLVLDTRALFQLARDHTEGRIEAGEARARLMEARGRFEYPPATEDASDPPYEAE